MEILKRFKDIYSDEFLNKFGKYKDVVGEIELDNLFCVNLDKIANACEIRIKYIKDLDDNFLETKNRTIVVSEFADEVRRRFLIAKGIARIIFQMGEIENSFKNYIDMEKENLQALSKE